MRKQGLIYKSTKGKTIIQKHYQEYTESFEFELEHTDAVTQFGRTHILMTGPVDGKPIIVLQGGNCINPMTLSWFASLHKDYRIFAPDTIGHPGFSEETRVSAKDDSLALWISDLMEYLRIEKCAFIGPSYGAGIILRLATFLPEKISCSILVSPAGIQLGSKMTMIKQIHIPLLWFKLTSSRNHLRKIADAMSMGHMKELDTTIIGDIFNHTTLEQDMPKLTEREELSKYTAPTMIIAGKQDVFFPGEKIVKRAQEIIPNLISHKIYDMGHFPSETCLMQMNEEIKQFLKDNY